MRKIVEEYGMKRSKLKSRTLFWGGNAIETGQRRMLTHLRHVLLLGVASAGRLRSKHAEAPGVGLLAFQHRAETQQLDLGGDGEGGGGCEGSGSQRGTTILPAAVGCVTEPKAIHQVFIL